MTTAILRIERIAPRGLGVGRLDDGKVVLVRNAAPEELVRVRLFRARGTWFGETIERIERGPMSAEPSCPVAEACGGCALQFVRTEAWARIKAAWAAEAFRGIAPEALLPLKAPRVGPRRRARIFRGADGWGFRRWHSHEAVPHAHCPMLSDALNDATRALREATSDARAALLVQVGDAVHLVLEGGTKPQALSGVRLWRKTRKGLAPLSGARLARETLPQGAWYAPPPGSFVQSALGAEHTLADTLLEWLADAETVGDLFCGAGALSLPLAAAGKRVIGADVDAEAVAAARFAARAQGLDAHYRVEDLSRPERLADWVGLDALVLDPPRSGAKEVLGKLGILLPRWLVMVHCDVASARRDATIAHRFGYRVQAIRAWDFFPGAGHVEVASLWRLGR